MSWDGVTQEQEEAMAADDVVHLWFWSTVWSYRIEGRYPDYKCPYLNQKKIILSVKGVS